MEPRQHARYVISSVGWELLGCDDVTWYCDDVTWYCDDVTWYCDDVKTARTVYNQQCRLGIVRIMSGSAATLCLIDVMSIFVPWENFTRISIIDHSDSLTKSCIVNYYETN